MADRTSPEAWGEFLEHLEEMHGDSLSLWECDFVDSVRTQIGRTRSLSSRQIDVLQSLRRRCDHLL